MTFVLDPEGVEGRAVHRLIDFRGKDVLEIGCGNGRLTWRYADDAASVLAIDTDQAKITQAKESTPEHLLSVVTFQKADILTLDTPRAAFDVIIFSWAMSFIPVEVIGDALEKAHQGLRPQGVALDINPRPTPSQVEVRVSGRFLQVGYLDESRLFSRINAARREVASMIWDGYFEFHDVKTFDVLYHFDSVEECTSFLAQEWVDASIDRETVSRAQDLLAGVKGQMVIREPMWAAVLKRL